MQKLHPLEFDVPTYHFAIDKIIAIASPRVIFIIHHRKMNGVWNLHYFTPQWEHFNGLSSNTKKDYMQKLCCGEVEVQTYHFGVHKIVGFYSYRIMFAVHHI
jgi:hypothetical protein